MNSSISHLLWAMSQIARGQYDVTLHARKRMAERKVTHADIQVCAETGSISPLEESRFKIVGRDCDDERS